MLCLAPSALLPRRGGYIYQRYRNVVVTMKARLLNYLITLVLVCLAGWAAFSLYHRYVENPWIRDSQVRANIVGIAPRVSGPIVRVAVHDNQEARLRIKARVRSGWRTAKFKATPAPIEIPPITTLDRFK